jgi:HlyD family secretion protein
MRRFLPVLVLVGIGAAIFALGSLRRGADDKPLLNVADDLPLTITVAKPERREITKIVQAPGDVEATLEVEISSEIVAKIVEMPVEENYIVKKGDLLCRLNDENLKADVLSGQARVAALQASIVQAEADLELADRDYRRQARLSEVEATTDKERFEYLTALKKAQALLEMRKQELAQAEAYLQRVKDDLKRTIISSPIGGIISKLNAKAGEVVITGTMNNPGTVIMSVSDLSKMQVRARVDEVDVPLVKAGQRARVFLQSDQQVPVPAQVVRVASKGTKVLGRDVVYFETLLEVLSDDPRIKPAMTANVEIEVDQRDDAITVPVEAIVHRMRKELDEETVKQYDAKQAQLDLSERAKQAQYIKVVYVKDGDVARVRLVEPGIADTRRVELRAGIGLGDVIITGPYRSLDQLKDGRKVALSEEDKKKEKSAEEGQAQAEVAKKDPGGAPGQKKPAEGQASAQADGSATSQSAEAGAGTGTVAAGAAP